MIGFSPYVHSLLAWEPGLTVVWCSECSSLTAVEDSPSTKTIICSRIDCRADLLKQAHILSTLKAEKENNTDSTEVDTRSSAGLA